MALLTTTPILITAQLLSQLALSVNPLSPMVAHSERHFPVYLGASPREASLGVVDPATRRGLPARAYERGAIGLRALRNRFVQAGWIREDESVQIEGWPYRDDYGQYAWTVARWRRNADETWRWIEGEVRPSKPHHPHATGQLTTILLPVEYDPRVKRDAKLLFSDFLDLRDLYAKPLAGNCIWTNPSGSRVYGAWTDPNQLDALKEEIEQLESPLLCRWLPMPARWKGQPKTWVLQVTAENVQWPKGLASPEDHSLNEHVDATQGVLKAPLTKAEREQYRRDVRSLTGERRLEFPISGRSLRLERKNSAQPDHQLDLLLQFLEERYAMLGITTERQSFAWRGIPQANLIAKIPGRLPRHRNRPVLLADHIDTAFAEEVFRNSGLRQSVPGADDNHAATGALLAAASALRGLALEHDVWLVHLTGEEFPADDLGARVFLEEALQSQQDFSGLILMDLIGVRDEQAHDFQIQPGDSRASRALGQRALGAAWDTVAHEGGRGQPLLRERFDPLSYIYNTDGVFFTETGYPVVYINEHMNAWENIERQGYHMMTDRTDFRWTSPSGSRFFFDWDYALTLAQTAIETAARVATQP